MRKKEGATLRKISATFLNSNTEGACRPKRTLQTAHTWMLDSVFKRYSHGSRTFKASLHTAYWICVDPLGGPPCSSGSRYSPILAGAFKHSVWARFKVLLCVYAHCLQCASASGWKSGMPREKESRSGKKRKASVFWSMSWSLKMNGVRRNIGKSSRAIITM